MAGGLLLLITRDKVRMEIPWLQKDKEEAGKVIIAKEPWRLLQNE